MTKAILLSTTLPPPPRKKKHQQQKTKQNKSHGYIFKRRITALVNLASTVRMTGMRSQWIPPCLVVVSAHQAWIRQRIVQSCSATVIIF